MKQPGITAADRAVELFDAGSSAQQIADTLGITLQHTIRALRQAERLAVYRPKAGGAMTGANLGDPNRADRLLRRFSWEERP
jgi:hypothetical protein